MPAVSIAPAETSPPGGGGSGSPSPPGPPGRAGIKRQHTCWSSGQQLAAVGGSKKGVTIMSRSPSVEESGEGEGEEEPKRASMSAAGLAMVFLRRSRRRNSDSKNEDEEMSTHAPMGHKESPIAPIGPEFGPRGVDRWVIHPNNGFKSFFDLIVVFAVLYTSFTLPMKLSFRLNFATELDALIDVLFILDVILQFFHGYTHQGYAVLDLRQVALRYVFTWFFIDILASLPLELIGLMSGGSLANSDAGAGLQFLQLLKIARLTRIRRMIQKWAAFSGASILQVISVIFGWLLLAHYAACIWYAIGVSRPIRCGAPVAAENVGIPPLDGRSWVTEHWPQLWVSCSAVDATTGDAVDIPHAGLPADCEPVLGASGYYCTEVPPGTRWINALYWSLATMTSMGYGAGPVAVNDIEMIFGIICQVMGACLYAAIFGNIAQLIAKLDASGTRYQVQLDRINEFIRFHHLPRVLAQKLHEYNNFLFAVNRGFDVEQIASALPPNLQQEVFLHLHEHLVRQVPMFEECDDNFIKALVQLLKPQVLLKGDCAFKVYELGQTMYFIQNGYVQIVSEDFTVVYCTLVAGSYFGELAMLTSQRRTATARAATDCILFYMTVGDFEEVIKDYPKYYDDILDKAMERLEKTLSANASMEVRMQHLSLKADILRQKTEKGLGTKSALDLHAGTEGRSSGVLSSAMKRAKSFALGQETGAEDPLRLRNRRGTFTTDDLPGPGGVLEGMQGGGGSADRRNDKRKSFAERREERLTEMTSPRGAPPGPPGRGGVRRQSTLGRVGTFYHVAAAQVRRRSSQIADAAAGRLGERERAANQVAKARAGSIRPGDSPYGGGGGGVRFADPQPATEYDRKTSVASSAGGDDRRTSTLSAADDTAARIDADSRRGSAEGTYDRRRSSVEDSDDEDVEEIDGSRRISLTAPGSKPAASYDADTPAVSSFTVAGGASPRRSPDPLAAAADHTPPSVRAEAAPAAAPAGAPAPAPPSHAPPADRPLRRRSTGSCGPLEGAEDRMKEAAPAGDLNAISEEGGAAGTTTRRRSMASSVDGNGPAGRPRSLSVRQGGADGRRGSSVHHWLAQAQLDAREKQSYFSDGIAKGKFSDIARERGAVTFMGSLPEEGAAAPTASAAIADITTRRVSLATGRRGSRSGSDAAAGGGGGGGGGGGAGSVIVMQQMGAMMQSIGELTRTVQQLSEKVDGKPSQAL